MVDVHLIKSETDYEAALARAEKLMAARAGTPEAEELEHLAMVIEAYEEKHHAIELPDPVSAIQFRMEQEGLSNKDLMPYIGSSAKVSEVLSGKRDLTLSMIRALNKHLGIPAEVLIQEPGGTIPDDVEGLEWVDFRSPRWQSAASSRRRQTSRIRPSVSCATSLTGREGLPWRRRSAARAMAAGATPRWTATRSPLVHVRARGS